MESHSLIDLFLIFSRSADALVSNSVFGLDTMKEDYHRYSNYPPAFYDYCILRNSCLAEEVRVDEGKLCARV